MSIPYLDPHKVGFPDPAYAQDAPDGLLAVGGDLTIEWLLTAYAMGIFPWFNSDTEEILWWSPAQRAVLQPGAMKVSRSLTKRIRNAGFRVSLDEDFVSVIDACAGPRPNADGTWITPRMRSAYTDLFDAGFAHCVAVYQDDQLVGGLYGVSLGKLFFGESMFSHQPDASKVAFYRLQKQLLEWDFSLIDCQMMNPHLASLGVKELPREVFLQRLSENDLTCSRLGRWRFGQE